MESITDNMQKYYNYKEQMGRLKKAIDQAFYLEAIFIEYAIIEDRLESVLRHSGKWNPKPGKPISIEKKINNVKKLTEEKKGIARKYFVEQLFVDLEEWKTERNRLIHALMKQLLHTEELKNLAEKGYEIVKLLNNKSSLYNKCMDKKKAKEQESQYVKICD